MESDGAGSGGVERDDVESDGAGSGAADTGETGPELKADDHVEVEVDTIGARGAGVGRVPDGRVVFVHRTAPGDRVRVQMTTVKKRWTRGRLLKVLRPGPNRREPACPHYERCGGCTLEHLEYGAQLQAKSQLVTDALERIGGREELPEVEGYASPREFRYRNRVTFTLLRIASLPGGVVAGFHELERPGRIVDVDGRCLLPEEPVTRVWEGIRGAWGPAASRLPEGRELRLTLRGTAAGEVLLLVQGGGPDLGDPEALLGEVEGLVAIWHREGTGEGTPDGGTERGADEPRLLAGVGELEESWFGERYPVWPGVFLQANRDAAEILHELVLRELGAPKGRRVVDAYCGVGVYGRRMARHGAEVVGIEAAPQAVAVARERPVEGFQVVEGRVEDELSGLLPADLVILNPPRVGVADGVMQELARKGPERVVYVSCDPATLARDVARLGDGYRIRRIQAFDLFPQTSHVETVLTLDRREGAPGAFPEPEPGS